MRITSPMPVTTMYESHPKGAAGGPDIQAMNSSHGLDVGNAFRDARS